MTKIFRLSCGCLLPHEPEPVEVIEVRAALLIDSQLEVVEKFLAGEELDSDERRSLRAAVWRCSRPHEWWRGRGRRLREHAKSTRRRRARRG